MNTCRVFYGGRYGYADPGGHRLKICFYLVLLSSLLLMRHAHGVGAADVINSDTLTIDRAVAVALENNLSLRTARTQIRKQEGVLTHAGRPAPSNPVLELKGGYRARPGSDTADIGIRIAQEIWIGGQGDLQQSAAENRLSAVRAEYEYLLTAVAARTRRAFMNVLWAREARATAQRTLRFARELEGYAKQRLNVGEATRLDLNTAKLGTARAHNALQKAEAAFDRACIQLTEILSIGVDELPPVAGRLDLEPAKLPNYGRLVNRATERRQDLGAAARRVAAARKELELSRRQVIPNLTVFGFFEREGGDDYIPGVGVSLPLPLLHRYEGETEQASARLERSLLERDELLLKVRHELALAMADYRAARNGVQIISNYMLNAAEKNVALVREAFREGEVGSATLATAQNNLLDVRDEYLQALQDLIRAGIELERVSGGLVTLAGVEKETADDTGAGVANDD